MSALLLGAAAVVLLNLYATALVLLRARVYGVGLYRPMLLNIGLSFLPVLLAFLSCAGLLLLAPVLGGMAEFAAGGGVAALWVYLIAATAVWLLFFPNSVYLITELNFSHRAEDTPVPLWFDIVQTLALTLSGIANAILSLAVVHGFFVLLVDPPGGSLPASGWVFAGVVIVLGAVGVYLGRYLRVNSWHVRHPASLLRKLGSHLSQRATAAEAAGFVVMHAVLIALLYVPLFSIGWAVLMGAS